MKKLYKFYLTLILLFLSISTNAQNACEIAFTTFKNDVRESKDLIALADNNPQETFDAWKTLQTESPSLRTNIDELTLVSKNLEAIKNAGGYVKWKELQQVRNDLPSFINKTLTQKLDDINTIWKTKYPIPDMLGGRSFFEDIMGQYRYTKSTSWNHTGDISFNVKGIDFYKGTQQGSEIYASTAVSMKTTIKTNVDEWLQYQSIKDNIKFLDEGLSTKGLFDPNNSLKMFITNAEIHIYMPKANITEALKTSWMNKLNTIDTKVKFEIKALEDFIQ
jgi:hypothetical protein